MNKRNDAIAVAHSTLFRFGFSVEVAACTWHLTFMEIVCADQKRITNNRTVEWMWKLDSMQHRFILTLLLNLHHLFHPKSFDASFVFEVVECLGEEIGAILHSGDM